MNLLSGFVQGLADGQKRKNEAFLNEELKKAQVKLFKQQLEDQDKTKAALGQLTDLLAGGQIIPNATPVDDEGFSMPQSTTAPMSIKQALASPQGQSLALKSGYKLDDIRQFQQPNIAELIAQMQTSTALGGAMPGSFEVSGLKVGPNGQMMPDLSRVEAWKEVPSPDGKSMIQIDRLGRQVGSRTAGPGEATDKVTPEQGGRIAGLVQAKDQVSQLREALVDNKGKVNQKMLFEMSALGPIEGVPLTEGRTMRQNIEMAISSIVYTRTGAAMPKEELQKTLNQLLPGPMDNDKGVKAKLDRLDQFLDGTLDVITLPPNVKQAWEKVKTQEKTKPKASGSSNTVDFSQLPP